MARADEKSADAAQSRGDFLGNEVAEIGIVRGADLRKIVEGENGDRGSIRDLGQEPRCWTLNGIGLAERRAQPVCRLHGGAGVGGLKGARRRAGDLFARLIHQRADFKRGLQPRGHECVGAGVVSPLRAGEVALRCEAPDQKPVAFLAQRIERNEPLGQRLAALAGAQEPQHKRSRDVVQTLSMLAEPFAERLVWPQRKVLEQRPAIERERF